MVHTRWSARVLATGTALAALLVTDMPSVAAVEPIALPIGAATPVPWYDAQDRTFHFGDTVVPSPAGQHMRGFRTTETGILISDNGGRLVHLTPTGQVHVVVTGVVRNWAVRTGTYAGRQVAAAVGRSGKAFLEVRRIADGSLVRRTPITDVYRTVHGMHSSRVWFGPEGSVDFVAHTFDVGTGRLVKNVVRVEDVDASYVNVRLNMMGLTRNQYTLREHVRVRPLTGQGLQSWTRKDFRVFSMSPDRKYAITSGSYDTEFDPAVTALHLRDLATGEVLARTEWTQFEPAPAESYTWEDNDTVLVNAAQYPPDSEGFDWRYITLRVDMDGTMERISGVGEQPQGNALSGPDIVFPLKR